MRKTSKKPNAHAKEHPDSKHQENQAFHASESKVPEGAENMEHALRRLVIEKEKKRSKDFGLYL